MADTRNQEVQGTLAERLKTLGVKGVLLQMAMNGQILELRCEMPTLLLPQRSRALQSVARAPICTRPRVVAERLATVARTERPNCVSAPSRRSS